MHRSELSRRILVGLLFIPALAVAQEDCKPMTDVRRLPALTKLLDSAGVVANLPADSSGPTEVLVSVMTGATPQAFVMDSLAARSAAGAAVRERVLSALKPEARTALSAFRVRVVLGRALGVSVEPSVLCPPRGKRPAARVAFTITGPAGAPGTPSRAPRPRDITPRIRIGVNGEVLQVDLGAGTGYPETDRSVRQALEGERYEPALLDGRPVQVWLRDKQVELVR